MKKMIIEQTQSTTMVSAPKDELTKLQIDMLKDKGQLVNLALGKNGEPVPVNVGGKLYTAAIKTKQGNYIVYDGRILTYKDGKYDYYKTTNGNIGTVRGMPDENLSGDYKQKLNNLGINETNVYSVLSQSKNKLQEFIKQGAIGNIFRDFNDLLQYYYPNDDSMRLVPKDDTDYNPTIDKEKLDSMYTPSDLSRYGIKGSIYVPKSAAADIVQMKLTTKDKNCQTTLSNFFVNALQSKATKQPTLSQSQINSSKNDIQVCYGLGAYDIGKFQKFDEKNTPVEVRKGLQPYGFLNKKLNFKEIKKTLSQIPDYSLEGVITEGSILVDDRLKKIIRENLIEISNNKKKSLVEEYNVINLRFGVITEAGKPKTKKQKEKFVDDIINEIFYLKSQGFNEKLINEQFFDIIKSFFGQVPGGIFDTLKERFVQFVLEKLGLGSEGYLANIFIAAIGNIPIGDYINGKVFDCQYLSNVISKSVGEGIARKIQNEKGMDGYFYDIVRNAMVDMFTESSFGDKIETAIGKMICPGLPKIKEKLNMAGETMKEKAMS